MSSFGTAAERAPGTEQAGRMKKNWMKDDAGAATAEYAIATLAAVGFAGLLVVILRSDEVRSMLTDIVRSALQIPG